jgi:uncharacterized glyoxalase superfamily protein PhnB
MPEEDKSDWARPIFHVTDLAKSLQYYCDQLGFNKLWVFGGPNHENTPTAHQLPIPDSPIIAGIERNGIDLILDQSSNHPKATLPSVIGVELHDYDNLGSLYDKMIKSGARIKKAPFKVDWAEDTMQMELEDLDGNVLIFWGNIPK